MVGVGAPIAKPGIHPSPALRASSPLRGEGVQLPRGERVLDPALLAEGMRVVMVGDKYWSDHGRAWLLQSASAFKIAGMTDLGIESVRADHQPSLDGYRAGRVSRQALLAELLGKNDGPRRVERRLLIEETLSLIDAANLAGLRVRALGMSEVDAESAFETLTGTSRMQAKVYGRAHFSAQLRAIRTPLERVHGDDLGRRIAAVLEDPEARLVVLAAPSRLSQYSTAGRLEQEGFRVRTAGFWFPDENQQIAAPRPSGVWAFVPLRRSQYGMDALLLAPAELP